MRWRLRFRYWWSQVFHRIHNKFIALLIGRKVVCANATITGGVRWEDGRNCFLFNCVISGGAGVVRPDDMPRLYQPPPDDEEDDDDEEEFEEPFALDPPGPRKEVE